MTMLQEQNAQARRPLVIIAAIAVVLALVGFLVFGPFGSSLRMQVLQSSTDSLRESVLDCAVQCYAVEGFYPSELSYLENYYGLQIDHKAYVVSYEAIGANVAPSVKVVVRGSS